MKSNCPISYKTSLIFLIVFSFATMLICSATSPIYNGHDWTDANTYLTMAHGLLNGAVPYRDLFDHKGPFLYFIYALATLIAPTGFLGVFFLQTFSMFLTLYFLYKIFFSFTGNSNLSLLCSCIIPFFLLTAGVYYLPQNLDYGGGSAEEFCIPLFSASFWIITKGERNHNLERKDFLWLGLLMGIVLQIKFNLALFWLGLLTPILVYVLVSHQIKHFLLYIIHFISGIIISVIPYLSYALFTNSLSDFFTSYILFNRSYAIGQSASIIWILKHILLQTYQTLMNTPIVMLCIISCIVGLFFIRCASILWKLSVFCSLIALGISIFVGRVMAYTLMPFLLFSFIIVLSISIALSSHDLSIIYRLQSIPLLIALLFFTITQNKVIFCKDLKAFSPPSTCQQQIAEIIRRSPIQNPTLLEAGMLNRGFYNELDIIPTTYYFYLPNVEYTLHPEILDSQIEYIAGEKTDYVVLQNESKLISPKNLPQETILATLFDTTFNHYQLITIIPGTGAVDHLYYYLFKVK